MFGFLFKSIFMLGIVGLIGGFAYFRFFNTTSFSPGFSGLIDQVKTINFGTVATQVSSQLDRLITHTDRSPMVMGIDITNKSLEAMVDTLRSLPPEEMDLVRQLICQPVPTASPSTQSGL